MVRVVGSHHFAVTGQVVPIMYPYSKRHNPEHRTTMSWHRRSDDNFTNQQAEDNKLTNKKFSNIPHLDQLDRMVIDADSAQRAVEAVKCLPKTEANVVCSKQEESDNFEHNTNNQSEIIARENIANDQNTDIDSNDVDMFDSTCSKECGNLDFDDRWRGDEYDAPSRKRHLTGDTESDSTETQTTDGCSVKKDRRRQRNKLSARAYRDRKRTKDQEQFQTLANLEAEQRYLLESVRKLQEEKRQFLQYLKTERNIDMPYEESDVTCTLASMS